MRPNKLVDIPCHICGSKENKCVTFEDCPQYKVPHESGAPNFGKDKTAPKEVEQVDYKNYSTKL